MKPSLILPEVIDPQNWLNQTFPWVDREHYVMAFLAFPENMININTELVKPDEIKSYNDLLNIKWKKNIIMHSPAIAGTGNQDVWALRTIMGEAFLRALAEQEPLILEDQRLIVEWLARGKYPLALFAANTQILEFRKMGAPLDSVSPKEGTHVAAGAGYLSLPKKAPHPNASKVFINWFLSKEGQTVYVKASQIQSARENIPIELVSPDLRRQPGLKYYNFVSEEELLGESNRIRFAMDIFGPLIKK